MRRLPAWWPAAWVWTALAFALPVSAAALAAAGAAAAEPTAPRAAAAGPVALPGAAFGLVRDAAPLQPPWSAEETRRILSHGPWPAAPARDPGNAVAGQRAAAELGQRLFFDPRLSLDGRMSCASCHVPGLAFADGRPRSMGRDLLDRNAPSLWNAVHGRWYGWDGASDSLWSQSLRVLLDAREMATSPIQVQQVISGDAELACRFRRAFARTPDGDPEAVMVDAAKALGAFVGSLTSGRTAFDAFREALARADRRAAARYPADAQRGLRLFVGRGQCSTCHVGALFSNGEFGDIGAPFFVRPGVVDPGRHGGIQALQASRYNLLSRFSAAAPNDPARLKTRHVHLQHRNFGEFKVPSLRNVALTGPYLHDGQLATLDDVVRHYSELDLERLHADGDRILRPLKLTAGESADLVAFLRSLSDPHGQAWRAPTLRPCAAALP